MVSDKDFTRKKHISAIQYWFPKISREKWTFWLFWKVTKTYRLCEPRPSKQSCLQDYKFGYAQAKSCTLGQLLLLAKGILNLSQSECDKRPKPWLHFAFGACLKWSLILVESIKSTWKAEFCAWGQITWIGDSGCKFLNDLLCRSDCLTLTED